MPFVGTPVLELVGDRELRLTGISLQASVTGTIGLFQATGVAPDIKLPESFVVDAYTYGGVAQSISAGLQVVVVPATAGPVTNLPVSVVKSGTTQADWRVSIVNTNSGLQTQDMEIWFRFIGGGRVTNPGRVKP